MSVAGLSDGDSFDTYAPKPKKAKVAHPTAVTSVVAAAMAPTATTLTRTSRQILGIMNGLELDDVASYFDKDDDDIDPYVVCDGVSVEAFNAYVGDGEGLPVALRFLDLTADGRILIVELPTTVHESTASKFEYMFLAATGNEDEVATGGSTTSTRAGLRKKEADATFGPMGSTPNQTAPPAPRTISDWVTLAVEVGRTQSWASLTAAASWWAGYAGIQYVLLLKVSARGTQIAYRLYDIVTPGVLPDHPTHSDIVRRRTTPNPRDVTVSFNMHRILSIPAHQPLPDGVNPVAVVNLRTVMDQVIRCLG
ncbi:hypothetical protein DYB36_006863 [Aphanomyces astaci]|uniref:Uncharacterized protein n=1 Tax=Aphanomyces astaci TaxID=112090 RepID=A0A397A0Q2_APHAT|nr:hypothetical protein DYB36_006863 [Aphanomyces astaci]